jgi:hypothetical protein
MLNALLAKAFGVETRPTTNTLGKVLFAVLRSVSKIIFDYVIRRLNVLSAG